MSSQVFRPQASRKFSISFLQRERSLPIYNRRKSSRMNTEAKAKHLTSATRVILLTSVYFLGGMLGKAGAFMNGDIALVWPPAGIALAAILLFGYRFIPGVAFGAFVFSFMDGKPLGFFTVGTAIGNSVGAMICAYLLQKSVQFRNSFERVRDVASFVVLASV